MFSRRPLPPFLLVLVALLAPVLTAAVLPDPTWRGGVFDAGDADELLALVWDQSGTVAAVPALVSPRALGVMRLLVPVVSAQEPAVPSGSRAPPVR